MASAVLNVPDISCGHCEATITKTLSPVAGIQTVTVDIDAKKVRVEFDPAQVDLDRMKALLDAEDYPVASTESA